MDDTTRGWIDHSRERQLWCAVIERAVQDAIRPDGPGATAPEHVRQREEARRWFADNSHDFRSACDAAGFDPDFLRDRVLRMTDDRTCRQLRSVESDLSTLAVAGRTGAFL